MNVAARRQIPGSREPMSARVVNPVLHVFVTRNSRFSHLPQVQLQQGGEQSVVATIASNSG
jgi:hypothetical protein